MPTCSHIHSDGNQCEDEPVVASRGKYWCFDHQPHPIPEIAELISPCCTA
jgi:hypothetical protein